MVRTPNLGTVTYSPALTPSDSSEYSRFLTTEFSKIQAAITSLASGHLDMSTVAVTKPRDGDFRYADGANWNPSSGKGFYWYDGASLGWKWYPGGKTNSATIGAVTINSMNGRCNIAAGASSVVVTNNLVTATSNVFAVVAQNDLTAIVKNVVSTPGSFTITLNAAATANTAVNFFVFN